MLIAQRDWFKHICIRPWNDALSKPYFAIRYRDIEKSNKVDKDAVVTTKTFF